MDDRRHLPSRRGLIKAAAAGAALAALGWRAGVAAPDREKDLLEPATKEGQLVWYTSQSDEATASALVRDFEAHYSGIKVTAVRTTAQEAFRWVTEEIKSSGPLCDVLSTTDIGHCVQLKDKGVLEKYIPANSYELADAYKNLDPEGYYHTTAAGMVNVGYATNHLKEEDAPQTWQDLLDPKWKNKLILGHPAFSGYAGTWAVMLRKLYGWDYFDKLAQNNPEVVQSMGDTVATMKSGQRILGTASNAALLSAAARGSHLAPVYPTDGAVLIIAPSAVMKAARHPNAAKLFMEYLQSVDGSKIRLAHFNESIRPEETALPRGKSAAEVKTIRPGIDEIVKGIPEIIKQWHDTFGA